MPERTKGEGRRGTEREIGDRLNLGGGDQKSSGGTDLLRGKGLNGKNLHRASNVGHCGKN